MVRLSDEEIFKRKRMAVWRRNGVNDVTDKLWEVYINVTHCECCLNPFKSSRDKQLDHNHDTGDFRWVLCARCNTYDNWKYQGECVWCKGKDNTCVLCKGDKNTLPEIYRKLP